MRTERRVVPDGNEFYMTRPEEREVSALRTVRAYQVPASEHPVGGPGESDALMQEGLVDEPGAMNATITATTEIMAVVSFGLLCRPW